MNRRTALTILPTAATTLLTAGCVVPGRLADRATPTTGPTPTRTDGRTTPTNAGSRTGTPTSTQRRIEFDPERVATEVTLGDRTEGVEGLRPHSIRVWNDTPAERMVGMELRRSAETVLDEEYAVPADASVAVVLKDPAVYTAALRSGDAEATIDIGEKWFDCNNSSTEVALSADPSFRWQFVTTFAECRS